MKKIVSGFLVILLNAGTVYSQSKKTSIPENEQMTTIAEIKQYIQGGEWTSLSTELRPFEDRLGTGKIQPFYV